MLQYLQEQYSAPLSLSGTTFSPTVIPNVNEGFPSSLAASSFPDIPNFEYNKTTKPQFKSTVAHKVIKQCNPDASWRVADGFSSTVTVSVPCDMGHEYWRRTGQTVEMNTSDSNLDGYLYLFKWNMKDKDQVGVERFPVKRWGSTELFAKLHAMTRAIDIIRHIRRRILEVKFGKPQRHFLTGVNNIGSSDDSNTSPIPSSCPVLNLGAYLHNEWHSNAKTYFTLSPPSTPLQTLSNLIKSPPASTPSSILSVLNYYKVRLLIFELTCRFTSISRERNIFRQRSYLFRSRGQMFSEVWCGIVAAERRYLESYVGS